MLHLLTLEQKMSFQFGLLAFSSSSKHFSLKHFLLFVSKNGFCVRKNIYCRNQQEAKHFIWFYGQNLVFTVSRWENVDSRVWGFPPHVLFTFQSLLKPLKHYDFPAEELTEIFKF